MQDATPLSQDDQQFLQILHNPNLREALLEHLREQGLIDAFLAAESETTPTT